MSYVHVHPELVSVSNVYDVKERIKGPKHCATNCGNDTERSVALVVTRLNHSYNLLKPTGILTLLVHHYISGMGMLDNFDFETIKHLIISDTQYWRK